MNLFIMMANIEVFIVIYFTCIMRYYYTFSIFI